MVSAEQFDPAFVQTMFVARQENAQAFEMAIWTGATMIIIQVATGVGYRFVIWTYDQVKRFWFLNVPTGPTRSQTNTPTTEPSPQRPRRFEEQFEDVTPEEVAWAQLSNPTQQEQHAMASNIHFGQQGYVQQEEETFETQNVQQEEQVLHGARVASRNQGTCGTTTQPQDDNKFALQFNDWWTTGEKQQLLETLRTSEVANRRLQKQLNAVQGTTANTQQVSQTSMLKRIVIIPSLNGKFDFKVYQGSWSQCH